MILTPAEFFIQSIAAAGTLVAAIATWRVFLLERGRSRPSISVRSVLDPTRQGFVLLVVENSGENVARDIRFRYSQPLMYRVFANQVAESGFSSSEVVAGPFRLGIPALGPRETRTLLWGDYGGLRRWLGTREIAVTATFEVAGDPDRLESHSVLEVWSFETCDIGQKEPVVEKLDRIAKSVEQLGTQCQLSHKLPN